MLRLECRFLNEGTKLFEHNIANALTFRDFTLYMLLKHYIEES